MELTKDADKLCCATYKVFLERRKSGISKETAKYFDFLFYKEIPSLASWLDDDVDEILSELNRNQFIQKHVDGGFVFKDSLIIYMENRFKNGFTEVADFISKFIP